MYGILLQWEMTHLRYFRKMYDADMSRVLVIGGVAYNTMIYLEHFPEPRSQTIFSRRYHETVGETGAGKALNLRKLGLQTTLHAVIGQDDYGRRIIESMQQSGINFLHDVDPAGTERHVNLMAESGGRISIYMAYATNDPEYDAARLEALLPTQDYVVLNIINYARRLIPAIRAAGKETWCDIHDWDGKNAHHRDFVNAADYLFLSSDSMPGFRGFMEEMIRAGKKLVVCTHGKQGSTALTLDGQWIETPILDHYPRVDTNGAGDSFFAGYLYGHSKGYPPEKCLRIATIVAGLCISSPELAFPTLTETLVNEEYRKYYG